MSVGNNGEKTNGIFIFDNAEDFLKVMEEIQAQYLARHEKGVGENE